MNRSIVRLLPILLPWMLVHAVRADHNGPLLPNPDLPTNYALGMMHNGVHADTHVSDRRRLTTFFPNEQSPFHGVQINYVNVRKGNLTFLLRDIVRVDRLPIVFGRVFDSSLGDSDFGVGWRLSVAETISQAGGGLEYTDSSNSKYELRVDGDRVLSAYPNLTGIQRGKLHQNALEIYVNGLTKRFMQIEGLYRLTEVSDRTGNAVVLHYDQSGRVRRVSTNNDRHVEIFRDAEGRIVGARDDVGRSVSYLYSQGNLTEFTDIAAARWSMTYTPAGRLAQVVDPRGEVALEAAFDSSGRAERVAVQYDDVTYAYDEVSTTLQTTLQRSAQFWHHSSGLTETAQDFEGGLTALTFDNELKPVSLAFNGSVIATLTYDSSGKVQTLLRYLGHTSRRETFFYDTEGRLREIRDEARTVARYSYDSFGNVTLAQDRAGTRRYAFSNDQIRTFSGDAGTPIRLSTDRFGLITDIREPDQRLEIRYTSTGSVEGLMFSRQEGNTQERYEAAFSYDGRGLRTDGHYSEDDEARGDVRLEYDLVGNMKSFTGSSSTLNVQEFYEIGGKNQLERVRKTHLAVDFGYDAAGRLDRMAVAAKESRFRHDELGRLSGMSVSGTEIFSSDYGPMDLDVAAEADRATPFTDLPYTQASSIFGSLEAIVYSRPRGSLFGPIRFNQTMGRFVVGEVSAPDSVVSASLLRRGVPFSDESGKSPWQRTVSPAVMGFDKPSNSLFLPPEYFTVNCVWCAAYVNGVILKANGQTGSISVTTGQTVTFDSYPGGSSFCYFYFEPTLYDFEVGHYIEFGDGGYHYGSSASYSSSPVSVNHSYSQAGSFSATTTVGCTIDVHCTDFDYSGVAVSVCDNTKFESAKAHFWGPRASSTQQEYQFADNGTYFSFAMEPYTDSLPQSDANAGFGYWNSVQDTSSCGYPTVSANWTWQSNINNADIVFFLVSTLDGNCGTRGADAQTGMEEVRILQTLGQTCQPREEVVAHEIGHVLGFLDSDPSYNDDIMDAPKSVTRSVKDYHAQTLLYHY